MKDICCISSFNAEIVSLSWNLFSRYRYCLKNNMYNPERIKLIFCYTVRKSKFYQHFKLVDNATFSFVLNKVIVDAKIHNTKRNKTGIILYACDSPPLNSRVKNETSFEFLFYVVLLRQSVPLSKIYEKILYSVSFTKPELKFCAQKFWFDFVKPLL